MSEPSEPPEEYVEEVSDPGEGDIETVGVGAITPTFLILANILLILGVFLKKWGAFDVLRIYWFEFAFIGILGLFKMLFARVSSSRPGGKPGAVSLYLMVFCCTLFMCGILLLFLFDREASALPTVVVASLCANTEWLFWICVAGLGLSHVLSFFLNYLGLKEVDWMRGAHVFKYPFVRSGLVLGASLVLGLLFHAFRSPAWAMILIIVVKTLIDLRMHFFVHRPGQSSGRRRRRTKRSTQTIGLMN